MTEHEDRHLPVYEIQLMSKITKCRILHWNLLFPFAMGNKSDEKQLNMEQKESKVTDTKEENDAASVEHVDNYEGQITRSKTKKMENALLLKANILMSNHFNDQ